MELNRRELVRERLRMYLDAEKAILQGAQSYSLENRSLTRADLRYVQSEINEMLLVLTELESRGKVGRVVFVD